MFEVPKPRQFHYQPRFYDPEKERWEALKKKYALSQEWDALKKEYALSQEKEEAQQTDPEPTTADGSQAKETELAYFEQKVRDLDRQKRQSVGKLTWRDLFRKREMPTFNYQPRFAEGESQDTGEHLNEFKKKGAKIKRRFDVSDTDYMKPIPASRIIIYTLLVCLLLYWILF